MSNNRRDFLKTVGAISLVAGCSDTQGTPDPYFKNSAPFIQHGTANLESKLENQEGFLTPVDQFFVRNNDVSLDIPTDRYRLVVEGNAIARPLSLSYNDLRSMPRRTVFSYLECGGNQRAFFGELLEQIATGTQWARGAVGMAEWTGVPLVEVLQAAGVQKSAVAVQLIGMDEGAPEGGFRRPLPMIKAMDPDTLLVLRMNGSLLPKDHGAPVRALVPGWVGSSSVKWLGRIEVSDTQIWSRNNTTSYVLIGKDYPPEGQALGKIANKQSLKSTLALPWPATLGAGFHRIYGYAYGPNGPITRVRWSPDSGSTWQDAKLLEPRMRYGWTRFELDWNATLGNHTITTCAVDSLGTEQPATIPFNEKGYLFNMQLPHPIQVLN
ncbi:MAG: sulfite oxidase [Bacteroidetes bacterium]|nr:sulfite oxidase [Bacteroidota bacterium]MCY4205167.1 sulfite oxidase [Bacteroidota bacterium]